MSADGRVGEARHRRWKQYPVDRQSFHIDLRRSPSREDTIPVEIPVSPLGPHHPILDEASQREYFVPLLSRALRLGVHASLHAQSFLLPGLYLSGGTGGSHHLRRYHLSLGLWFDVQRLQSLIPVPAQYRLSHRLHMLAPWYVGGKDADPRIPPLVGLALQSIMGCLHGSEWSLRAPLTKIR